METYIVKKKKKGDWYFELIAQNGKLLITSYTYASEAGCLNGIELIKKYAYTENIKIIK